MPDPVVKEIASAIHVRHIQTPIGAAEPFTRSSRVAEVLAHMELHKYDVTPVFRGGADHTEAKSDDPDGTLWKTDVMRLDPAAEVGSVARPLASSVLIDSNASLIELLDHFRAEHIFRLVVGGRGLDGIVTPSDMNKQAGRAHLFMQVSALELALAEMVRTANRLDSELLEALPRTRAERARSLLARKQDKDEAADLVAALDFQDLLYVVRARTTLDDLSAMSDEQIRGLSDFRNRVMHSVLDPAGDERDRLEHLLTHTALVARLLDSIDRVAWPGQTGKPSPATAGRRPTRQIQTPNSRRSDATSARVRLPRVVALCSCDASGLRCCGMATAPLLYSAAVKRWDRRAADPFP